MQLGRYICEYIRSFDSDDLVLLSDGGGVLSCKVPALAALSKALANAVTSRQRIIFLYK